MTVPFKVKSIFEYKSEYDDDLSFPVGEVIVVNEVEDDDWYSGTLNGKSGMFPKNFVEKIGESQNHRQVPKPEPIDTGESVSKEVGSTVDDVVAEDPVEEPKKVVESDPIKESPIPSPIEQTKAAKSAASSSESPVTSPVSNKTSVPLPGALPKDPYAIKKDFIASAKSSYIPQYKPRDNSFLVDQGHHDTAPTEVYRENMHKEEEAAPEEKLSLKERIALLQKRQQEEAEREAAAIKRQEERKKKLAADKERKAKELEFKAQEAENQPEPEPVDVDEDEGALGEGGDEFEPTEAVRPTDTGSSLISKGSVVSKGSVSSQGGVVPEPEAEPVEEEEEEPVDDDDDEEIRRRKLVERMAKISGGRNMFGMMGMSPFGAPPAKTPRASATKEPVPESDPAPEEDEEEEDEEEEMKPVPMLPFADPAALEKLKKKEAPAKEDSSLGEEDDTDQDLSARPPPPVPTIPPVDKATAIGSDSGVEEEEDEIKLNKPVPEPVSYDADDNDSEKTAGGEPVSDTDDESDQVPVVPAVPVSPSVPPVPTREVPKRPEAPASPVLTIPVSSVPPVPPVPGRSNKEAPPIPKDLPVPPVPSRSIPPPVTPTAPVPPPVPVPGPEELEDSDADEFVDPDSASDNSFSFTQPSRANTAPSLPPPVPEGRVAPPIPDSQVPPALNTKSIKRSSTEIYPPSGLTYNNTGSSLGSGTSIRRGSTDKSRGTQADTFIGPLQEEISDPSSSWWLKDSVPDIFASKIGTELLYEVDTNTVTKRGNRQKIYKDFYILFHDLSSIVVELEYEAEDPRTTVKFTDIVTKPIPIVRKDLMDKYYKKYGTTITKIISSTSSASSIIDLVFGNLDKTVLPPIGSKSFGVTIYKNINNHNVQKLDEIRPGDILCIKNGKFQVHKSIGSKTVVVGDEEISASVIYEHDPKKDKFKVVSVVGGHLKKEAFKMSEMKNGQVRVFRVVGRDHVEW